MKNRYGFIKRILLCCAVPALFAIVLIFSGTEGVEAAETGLRLNVTETSIAKDAVYKLRVYNVPANSNISFWSSDTSVAFVDKQFGYITGISCGECVVTVSVTSSITGSLIKTLKCNVTVGPAAISVKFTKSEVVLGVGMRKLLKTIVSPLNTVEKPVFYCSDKEVATVSSIGRVKAKSAGEAVVFALLLNGESAECQVYVLSEEQYKEYLEKRNLEEILEGSGDNTVDENDPSAENDASSKEDSKDGEKNESKDNSKDNSKDDSQEDSKDDPKDPLKDAPKPVTKEEKH